MNKQQIDLVTSLVKISENKTKDSLLEELKEMYRYSIKMGKRKEFIEKVKSHADVMGQKSITEIFSELGEKMFSFANILAGYVDFIKWLEKMTGQTFFKGDMA